MIRPTERRDPFLATLEGTFTLIEQINQDLKLFKAIP